MGTPFRGATNGQTAGARAVALVGPAGTGKTSLLEAILHAAGALDRTGAVAAGTSVGDASPEARARGSSTELNLAHFEWLGDRFTLIDLPGSPGFVADGLGALTAADLALVVVDPSPERAGLAEPMLRRLDALGIPHVIVVNRIDGARADTVQALLAALQPLSAEPLALRQIPIRERDQVVGYVDLALERAYRYRPGAEAERIAIPAELAEREQSERSRLLETLADFDDALLETLLGDEMPDVGMVMADLAEDTGHNRVVPVVLTSALTGGGVHRLLKLLRHETPGPQAAAERIGTRDGIHVFKIGHGGPIGRLAYARVYGAPLHEGDELVLGGEPARCGALFAVQGEKTTKLAVAQDGDIVAMSKLDQARAGMVLARKGGASAQAPAVDYPPLNAALVISARDHKDDVKLSAALHKLCEEDPALEWRQDEATREAVLRGVSEDHLATAMARLQRRFGVAVSSQPPRVPYRESIRKPATQRGRHKKQSGGHGQFGDVTIEIAPRERGAGFVFVDRITGGAIPRQWIPAVELGVRDAMQCGPLGCPVVDVAVTLVDGGFHAVDSSELAFRIAGRMAMSEALANAAPYLLEPVCRVVVDTPAGTGSKAGSALSSRRGQILGLVPHPAWERWERVEALLPEAALPGLDAELSSLSQGLAQFTAAVEHLAELSGKRADDLLKTLRETGSARAHAAVD